MTTPKSHHIKHIPPCPRRVMAIGHNEVDYCSTPPIAAYAFVETPTNGIPVPTSREYKQQHPAIAVASVFHGIALVDFRFDYNLLSDKGASNKLEDLIDKNNGEGEVSDQEPLS